MRPEAKREAAVRANEEMQKIASYEKAIDTEGAVAEYKDVEMEDVEEGTDDEGAFAAQVQIQVQVLVPKSGRKPGSVRIHLPDIAINFAPDSPPSINLSFGQEN